MTRMNTDKPLLAGGFVIQCAWCRRVQVGIEWIAACPVAGAEVSHGCCPDCARVFGENAAGVLEADYFAA